MCPTVDSRLSCAVESGDTVIHETSHATARAMRDNRGFKDDVTTKGVDSTQRALVLRSSEASPPPAGGWALEISREVLDLVHQRGDGEDVLREGRPVREGLLDEVEEARVVEQEPGEHLLEDVHPELEVGEGLDHVAVDRLDARLPLVVKLAREVLHRDVVQSFSIPSLKLEKDWTMSRWIASMPAFP